MRNKVETMKYEICALIENSETTNIIVCSNVNWANEKLGGQWAAVPEDIPVGIGWQYIDGEFIAPPEPKYPEEENDG